MAAKKPVIAFDLYGTLLSTESVQKALAEHLDEDAAKRVAALWRRYQLEYTWRLNSMGIYRPFDDCTRGALEHALAELGLAGKLSGEGVEQVIGAYGSLDVFPEVEAGLAALSDGAFDVYIFSNGSEGMARPAVESSPVLQRHAALFQGVVTVDEPRAFKPTRKVYETLLEKAGRGPAGEGASGDSNPTVWLVSSNPFDIVGAEAAGLQTAWVDRTGAGWIDRLGHIIGGKPPSVVTGGVDTAVAGIQQAERDRGRGGIGP